jgi:hypothetical protein
MLSLLQPVRTIEAEVPKTPLKQWQHRRNAVIALASANGASQRLIADVFDLDPSRVARIMKEYRTRYGSIHGTGQVRANPTGGPGDRPGGAAPRGDRPERAFG